MNASGLALIAPKYRKHLKCGQPLTDLLAKYKYQPALTQKLDGLAQRVFSKVDVYEILLWKIGRFADLEDSLMAKVNSLRDISFAKLGTSKAALAELLRTKGVQLPMASAILRFRNPTVFQVIDERTCRIVYGDLMSLPLKGAHVSDAYTKRCTEIYFDYLRRLKKLANQCGYQYETLDRALYQLDIELKNRLKGSRRP
jgi:hypothetical protein